MSFQILNSEGEPIRIALLDAEAALFWDKEVHEKHYANPTPPFLNPEHLEGRDLASAQFKALLNEATNWYDMIGYAIHSPIRYTSGWNDIKCTLMSTHTEQFGLLSREKAHEKLDHIYLFLKPYFDLIDHWEAKGYYPQQTKD